MLFAREMGLQYIHTPFIEIEHGRGTEDWVQKWETFTNLGAGEPTFVNIGGRIKVKKVDSPEYIFKKRNTLYVVSQCHSYADRFPDKYSKMKEILRRKYAASGKNIEIHYDRSKVNIAVHIRRGDVKNGSDRHTGNMEVLLIIKQIISVMSDLKLDYAIRVYSEGNTDEFQDLVPYAEMHLSECPFKTFHNFVQANILVLAKSSYSYSAALFSEGIIIYHQFWHQPLREWIQLDTKNIDIVTGLKKSLQINRNL
jgi:hypothetical protein